MTIRNLLLVFFILFTVLLLADAVAPLGSGTIENPYQITTLDNLLWLSSNSSSWDKHYIQTAEIDASDTYNWNTGEGFLPIGDGLVSFTGTYNGNGYAILNLYINRPSSDFIGLFGSTDLATLNKIILSDANITGHSSVSFLVGISDSTSVSECSTSGNLKGFSSFVGGIMGLNISSYITCSLNNGNIEGDNLGAGGIAGGNFAGHIANCYNWGEINGNNKTGGIAGYTNNGSITNCYSTGIVTGSAETGGLVGNNANLTSISGCFWDTQTSNILFSDGGIGKTSDEMKVYQTYFQAGWDFEVEEENGDSGYWGINPFFNSGYPFLAWEGFAHITTIGAGTSQAPYQIDSIHHLWWLSQNKSIWDKHFIQTADINFTELYSYLTAQNESFTPIGNNSQPFSGNYDGNDRTLINFDPGTLNVQCVGLFGYVTNSVIKNLNINEATIYTDVEGGILIGRTSNSQVLNCNVVGTIYGDTIGGLIGFTDNTVVEYCSFSGTVSGFSKSGGIVGRCLNSSVFNHCNSNANISGVFEIGIFNGNSSNSIFNNCYSRGSLFGESILGGFSGMSGSSSYSNCYSHGDVTDETQPINYNENRQSSGGFIGQGWASNISRCYSTGKVNASVWAGGLIGRSINSTTVTASFWDIDNSNQSSSAGGVGKTSLEMKNYLTYLEANWDFIDETTNGTDNHWGINIAYNNSYPFLAYQDYDNHLPTLSGGSGSMNDPYLISSIEDLGWVSVNPTFWDAYFSQTCDIDASLTQNWNSGVGFIPIGTLTDKFTGSYNGNHFQIHDLHIDLQSTEEVVGLFRYIDSANCENITLTNVSISGYWPVGSLAGSCENSSVSNCSTSGSVSGYISVGNLIGLGNNSTIINCFSSGCVVGTSALGGLVGQVNYTNISNSYSNASVTGSYAIGGLCGLLRYCNIDNCYSTGLIDGYSAVGGLTGDGSNTQIISSFWNIETSNQSLSSGGIGKTTAEMLNYSTYLDASWDFLAESVNGTADIWGFNPQENNGYPFLAWQGFQHIANIDSPENVAITVANNQLTITWDEVSAASSYKVFACETPNGEFIDVSSDGFFGEGRSSAEINSDSKNNQLGVRNFSRITRSWTSSVIPTTKFFSVKAVQ